MGKDLARMGQRKKTLSKNSHKTQDNKHRKKWSHRTQKGLLNKTKKVIQEVKQLKLIIVILIKRKNKKKGIDCIDN